jgi:hypothetical protein
MNTGAWVVVVEYYGVIEGFNIAPNFPCICNPGFIGTVNVTANINTCSPCGTGSTTVLYTRNYWVPNMPLIAPGQMECTCMPGYYSTDGLAKDNQCTPCPYGAVGSGNQGYAATTCDVCMVGYYSTDGTPNAPGGCQKCAAGTSNTAVGSTSCPVCDVDFFSPSGNPPCQSCVDSSTGGKKGKNGCDQPPKSLAPTKSPASSPAPTVGATRRPTQPTAAPSARPTTPGLCPVGTNSTTGRMPCYPCTKGTTTDFSGSTRCDSCLAGYYGLNHGRPPCRLCPVGSIPTDDSSKCIYCVGEPPCFSTDPFANLTNYFSRSDNGGAVSLPYKPSMQKQKHHHQSNSRAKPLQVDFDVRVPH